MGYAIDITNQKFNRLTAIRFSHKQEPRYHYWLFKCDCGNEKTIRKSHVLSNKTLSCGCYSQDRKNRMKIGAITRDPIHHTWEGIKSRCGNINNPAYKDYGGRGIRICDTWLDFRKFKEDMGERPSKNHSIDRINNDGNYEPSNCRWATKREQSRNTRKNRNFIINGVTRCVTDWANYYKIDTFLVFLRLRRGWSIKEALNLKNRNQFAYYTKGKDNKIKIINL